MIVGNDTITFTRDELKEIIEDIANEFYEIGFFTGESNSEYSLGGAEIKLSALQAFDMDTNTNFFKTQKNEIAKNKI